MNISSSVRYLARPILMFIVMSSYAGFMLTISHICHYPPFLTLMTVIVVLLAVHICVWNVVEVVAYFRKVPEINMLATLADQLISKGAEDVSMMNESKETVSISRKRGVDGTMYFITTSTTEQYVRDWRNHELITTLNWSLNRCQRRVKRKLTLTHKPTPNQKIVVSSGVRPGRAKCDDERFKHWRKMRRDFTSASGTELKELIGILERALAYSEPIDG